MVVIATLRRPSSTARVAGLTAAIGLAAIARATLNGHVVPTAYAAGALFGVTLLGVAAAAGWRFGRPPLSSLAVGVAGGAVLVAVPLILHPDMGSIVGMRPQPFWGWAAVTIVVATAEEVAFRGALLDALAEWGGWPAAVALGSLAFALVHVPLYGLGVVPLDFAVGVWFAGLRLLTGSVAAPAAAHVVADLVTWWL